MRPRRAAVLVLGAVGLAVTLQTVFRPEDPLRSSLVKAVGAVRTTEARLVGLPFAPYPSPFSLEDSAETVGEAIDAITQAAAAQDPVALGDYALVELLRGHLDSAVQVLERLARKHSDARLLADLAAAYLARYERHPHPLDLVRALDAAARAFLLDPSLQEARHNRALALERLFMTYQAAVGWEDYRKKESDSDWAEEASRRPVPAVVHLKLGTRESEALLNAAERGDPGWVDGRVARAPERFRRYVEETRWGDWAEAVAAGRPAEAQRALAAARAVGDALLWVTGDSMVRDTAAALEEATAGVDRRRLDVLVQGHRAYSKGLRLADEDRNDEALSRFEEAARKLADGGSPFQGWAEVKTALFLFYGHKSREAVDHLERLESEMDLSRYLVLHGMSCRIAGWAHFRQAEFSAAARRYEEALPLFERAREVEQAAGVHFNFAETLRFLNESERAWQERYEALRMTRGFEVSVIRHNALYDSAEAALKQGFPDAALLFYGEMVQAARKAHPRNNLGIAETLVRRSRALHTLDRDEEALRDLYEVSALLAESPDVESHWRLRAEAAMVRGEILLRKDPGAAIRLLSEAISFCRDRSLSYKLPDLLHLRSRAFLQKGQIEPAERDLRDGIEESEARRRNVQDDRLKVSYVDQMQPLFDEMIRLQAFRRGDGRSGFDYAERARTRSLQEVVEGEGAPETARSLRSEEVQSLLPHGTALVSYSLLDERLLAGVLTGERFAFRDLAAARGDLEVKVARLRILLQSGRSREEVRRLLTELFDLLIRPLLADLDGVETVIVVPDESLYLVPFQALRDRHTGRYLIQDRTIGYAPSATLYDLARRRSLELAADPAPGVLVMGAPELDGDFFQGLLSLPGAEAEARQVAASYGKDADLRLVAVASIAAFLEEAPRNGIVHIASHALVNTKNPLLSVIALAPSDDPRSEPGPVDAGLIYLMPFDRTRLVVLSGCDTGSGPVSASEGVSSLARPFLAAGVPTVVASLWPVKDEAAASLFHEFHVHLKNRDGVLTALRKAQRSMLESADPELSNPAAWAPFQAIGGDGLPSDR